MIKSVSNSRSFLHVLHNELFHKSYENRTTTFWTKICLANDFKNGQLSSRQLLIGTTTVFNTKPIMLAFVQVIQLPLIS